ncbi:MAG: DUF177 domain-containing protein [Hyphomicrobiales bacterium]|nr:DUF177 domain-containing protein [Hyphomicrobiales bacterium]MDE2113295.1 DUF177 domain-containing protein [Hyphomicrobiales bacterium]
MMNPSTERPPFSRVFSVSELRDTGHEIAITATREECEALAKADQLVALSDVEADFRIQRRSRKQLVVSGNVRAQVTQNCVLTLEPFTVPLREEFEVRFEAPSREHKFEISEAFSEEPESDPPDPIIDGRIDLGKLAAEFLALGLDPYPRKPGAEFVSSPAPLNEERSPFAGLRDKLSQGDKQK